MDRKSLIFVLVIAVLALVAIAAIGSAGSEKEKDVPQTPDTPATPVVPDTPEVPDTPVNPDASTIRLDRYVVLAEITDLVTLTATVPQGQGEVSWSSSDASIAEVDGGRVQFKKWGPCVIAAESDGARAECLVVVNSYLHRSAIDTASAVSADIEGGRLLRTYAMPVQEIERCLGFYGYDEAAAREGASSCMGYEPFYADKAAERIAARGGYGVEGIVAEMVAEGCSEELARDSAGSVLKT